MGIAVFMLAAVLTGCAAHPAGQETSRENFRANALQGWNRCLHGYISNETGSGQSLSVAESMDSCQGYRYDIVSTYPPHLSGSINKMLTDAAYRSGFVVLSKKSEPAMGEMLQRPYRKAIDLMMNTVPR